MSAIDELPIDVLLAPILWMLAAGAIWHGVRRVAKVLCEVDHPASALRVVRGIRGVIIAVSLAALGAGVLFASKGLLVFGVIFLGEELYETGVLLLALRMGQRGVWAPRPHLAETARSPMPPPNTCALLAQDEATRLVDSEACRGGIGGNGGHRVGACVGTLFYPICKGFPYRSHGSHAEACVPEEKR
jgi:hypothetical protein